MALSEKSEPTAAKPLREPDRELDCVIDALTSKACAGLLGIPEDEEILLEDARAQVREAYRYGSLDYMDIVFHD